MSFQCYYQSDSINEKTRCQNWQDDYWCSEEHKVLWQAENYKDQRARQERQLKIKEIQDRLIVFAEKKKEERFKEQQSLI